MADDRPQIPLSDLSRWLVLAALVLAGIGCYFWFAPRTQPVVHPAGVEAGS